MAAYSLTFAGLAETKKGIFDCKVKRISILSIVEGKAKSFSSYKNGLQVGDSYSFSYHLLKKSKLLTLEELTDNTSKMLFGDLSAFTTDKLIKRKRINEFDRNFIFTGGTRIEINADEIIVNDNVLIRLERYYKNDWHGVIVGAGWGNGFKINGNVYGIECRHLADELSNIILYLEEERKKL